MRENYRIHPSRVLLGLSLVVHALIALAIAIYVDSGLLRYCGITLTVLLACRESAHWMRQTTLAIGFDPRNSQITLESHGQPYFQGKYKVYANRWFAILKLIDKRKNRTLILHPERFDSVRCYRNLRFALAGKERNLAA